MTTSHTDLQGTICLTNWLVYIMKFTLQSLLRACDGNPNVPEIAEPFVYDHLTDSGDLD